MNSKHASNCQELRTRFEGREAICVEKGALRVRVNNIRSHGGFHVRADVEEISTPGFRLGSFGSSRLRSKSPLRWTLGAGYLTTFSKQSWKAGYGGWSLYFDPEIVQTAVGFAAGLHDDADPDKSYREWARWLMGVNTHESDRLVFPDVVEQGSGSFRKSDLPVMIAKDASGWIVCPWCDMRFKHSDHGRWDGTRHLSCGQRLVIQSTS